MEHLLKSRSEINLIRLIAQCEEMVSANDQGNDWRIEKYIEKLEDLFSSTSDSERKPDHDTLKDYQKKIAFIKELLSSRKLSSIQDKALANHRLAPSSTSTLPGIATTPIGKQIRQVAATKYNKQMKEELFSKGNDGANGNVLKHRNVASPPGNVEEVLKHQQDQHERIAENFISLTRNLKHNITVSGKIIRDDTAVLKDASKKADQNVTRLKRESTRLETHLKKGTNWWLWTAIAIVCGTFLFMIFFIRFFPKPR